MITIVNVYQYVNKRGIQITCLVLSNGKSVHTTANRLASKGVNAAQIFSLIGCQINVFYFAIGEELRNGDAVTTANTIVRDYAVVKSMQLMMAENMAAMMMQQMGMGAAPTAQVAGVGSVNTETGEVDENEVEPVRETGDVVTAAAEADAVKVVEEAAKATDLPI